MGVAFGTAAYLARPSVIPCWGSRLRRSQPRHVQIAGDLLPRRIVRMNPDRSQVVAWTLGSFTDPAPMPAYSCRFTDAVVRPDRKDDLEALIQKMFARRHHNRVSAGPSGQMWLTVELVQALRRASAVYREVSTKTTGPLPFEIGFLRIRDGRLEAISDPLKTDGPEVFVRILSEFLEPGAKITLDLATDGAQAEADAEAKGGTWTVRGAGEVEKVEKA